MMNKDKTIEETGRKEVDRLFNRAIALKDKGKLQEALKIISMITETPPALDVLKVTGKLYWDMGQLSDATFTFRKATQHYPDDELASLALFHTLSNSEQYDEALSEMERFLSIAPSPEYESFRWQFYFEQGMRAEDEGKRVVLLERVTEAEPEYAEAFMELGKSYKHLGEVEKAEVALRKSIALDDDGWARLWLGNLFFSLGEWNEAEKEFIITQERLPDVAAPFWCLADVYWKRGDLIKSEQFYRAAVNLQPEDTSALARMGRFLLETGKRGEGEKYLQRALEEDPSNKSALKWKEKYRVHIEADEA